MTRMITGHHIHRSLRHRRGVALLLDVVVIIMVFGIIAAASVILMMGTISVHSNGDQLGAATAARAGITSELSSIVSDVATANSSNASITDSSSKITVKCASTGYVSLQSPSDTEAADANDGAAWYANVRGYTSDPTLSSSTTATTCASDYGSWTNDDGSVTWLLITSKGYSGDEIATAVAVYDVTNRTLTMVSTTYATHVAAAPKEKTS